MLEARPDLVSGPRPLDAGFAASAKGPPRLKVVVSDVMNSYTEDDLPSIVRYALETTRATAVCPFHPTVNIRIGDDGAETHAYVRARRIVKSDGTTWDREVLLREFKRQFEDAADGVCPDCAGQRGFAPAMT